MDEGINIAVSGHVPDCNHSASISYIVHERNRKVYPGCVVCAGEGGAGQPGGALPAADRGHATTDW